MSWLCLWWWSCHGGGWWHGRTRMGIKRAPKTRASRQISRRARTERRGQGEECKEGRAGAAAHSSGGVAAPPLLFLLSITAGHLDRDVTRPWHAPVHSLLCHSGGEWCNFLQRHWPKDEKTHTAPVCALSWSYRHLESPYNPGRKELHTTLPLSTCHGLTRSWRVPRAMDKWSSSPSTFSAWNLSQYKVSDSWTHWLLLVCAVFLWEIFWGFSFCIKVA